MVFEEVKKLLYVVRANYKKHFDNYSEEDLKNLAIAWGMCLENYTYEQASQGLKAFMITDTKGFPPTVGQIIEKIQLMFPPDGMMGAMEAWQLVYKAVCNSTYNAEMEFMKLPPLCQQVIGNASNLREMASMDADTVKSVEQSHFIRQYNENMKREMEMQKLPASMRLALNVTERKMIE